MTRLFDLLYHQLENHPLDKSLSGRDVNGNWQSYSSQAVVEAVEQAASGLLSLGLEPGDKVGIVVYKNRPEFAIMDFAIQISGMVSVPLYPTISVGEYEYILNEAEVKAAFCGTGDLLDKLTETKKKVKSLEHIFTFDEHPKGTFWKTIFDSKNSDRIKEIKKGIEGQDLVTIIYTSGTTGNPKGVMLTHNNVMHVVRETEPHMAAKTGDQVLSFLPMCHIFERAVLFVYTLKSTKIFFAGTDNLSGPEGDLASVKPVTFATVPRLLEKIYEAIYNKGLSLEGTKKKLFFWALALTDEWEPNQKLSFGKKIKWKIADKLIFSKWREAMGGNINAIVTGAAPCPVKIMRVFCAAGIPIREGYGLTETSPTLTVNTMEIDGVMLGTAGPIIDGVQILIDTENGDYQEGEGEILAHGPNVMLGYYKKPEVNAEVFCEIDNKRWFRTGDIGKLVKGPTGREYLKITDRKKELLKTSGGKYVAPAPIENRLREEFLVEQMMVIGDKQKFVSALIVPAEEALRNYCHKKDISWTSLEEIIQHKKVIKKYQKIIDKYNPEFSHVEQIKKFKLISTPWLPVHENGSAAELTPTLKLKRRVIREKYKKEIAEIYSE
ncbi:long-chain acyl-CoA synthetase [Maribacter caenipelagi]|uniref:Long-chain acyl-CoA synthetase n=1 Tax=Maribacter caenipelagi TaxID=1447781 RepID=A0A4R7D3S7_9FLAO|nr:long-chain fatty acid--CoA ligase [Maribacter caenipelagi]TDS14285.1 long-chain acyl-CoA synthetase [Maribacter caenipelagi]